MTADLSKSKLASKDKDELTQIAQAMGGKPSSRARKADIIDLIMELAMGGQDDAAMGGQDDAAIGGQDDAAMGGQDDAAMGGQDDAAMGGGEPEPASAPVYSADPMADARAAEAKERGGRGAAERPTRRARGGATDEGRADSGSGKADKGSAKTDDAKAGNGRARADDGKSRADDADGGTARKNGNGNGDGEGDNGDNDPVEPGNRRRRRRGRGRDRADVPDDYQGDAVAVDGVLDLRDDGYGFLRVNGYLPTREDVYVSVKQVRQFGLRKGDRLTGTARPANRSEKNPAMVSIESLNGHAVSGDAEPESRRDFEDLTPVLPAERLALEREDDPENHTARIIDLLAPVGKGQRGLIIAESGAGRTGVIRDIARSVETNHPDAQLMVLLVDERPEEVTEMRSLILNGDVITSTFDQAADEHASIADLTLERAKRLVELGEDVIIIFDGITRLARANSLASAGNNQVAATGISASAIHPAKRFFGSARNLAEGGSLTILAVVDSQPGSPIDDLILDEFVGTANMELRLSRDAALQRILPAIDVLSSTTRNEAALFEDDELAQVAALRRAIAEAAGESRSGLAALEYLLGRLAAADTNVDLLAQTS